MACQLDFGFLKGANLPWHNYGWDYGPCAWGHGYDPVFFETAFAEMAAKGCNAARLWVFGDGRAQPNFSLTHRDVVEGLDPQFFTDFDDMLSKAEKAGIKLIPVLFDFLAFEEVPKKDSLPMQGFHGGLFWDDNNITAFLENALIPMLTRYAGHPAILAWDIMNEPEWAINETGQATTHQKLALVSMQRFVGRCASAIHAHGGGALATLGSASIKWNWEEPKGRPKWCDNYWGDKQLAGACNGDPLARLDFYQIHYYPWMQDQIDPFVNKASEYCNTDVKPILIGEAQANLLDKYSAAALAKWAQTHRYSGLLFWSYHGVDDKGKWPDFCDCWCELDHAPPAPCGPAPVPPVLPPGAPPVPPVLPPGAPPVPPPAPCVPPPGVPKPPVAAAQPPVPPAVGVPPAQPLVPPAAEVPPPEVSALPAEPPVPPAVGVPPDQPPVASTVGVPPAEGPVPQAEPLVPPAVDVPPEQPAVSPAVAVPPDQPTAPPAVDVPPAAAPP